MIASEVLDALLRAGATAEMIVAAVKADAAKDAEALETKRAKDRERQRRHRASRDVTVTDGDTTDEPSPLSPPLKVSPDPFKTTPPLSPQPREKAGRARAGNFHRLPEGWQPAKPLPAPLQAKVDLWPPGELDDQIACFKRWAANAPDQAGKGRKLDWDKALWNWLTKHHDERKPRNGTPQPVGSLRGTRPEPALDLYRAGRAAEEAEREDDHPDWRAWPAIQSLRPS